MLLLDFFLRRSHKGILRFVSLVGQQGSLGHVVQVEACEGTLNAG